MADIKEQDLELLAELPDNAWIRVGTNTTNNRITIGNLKTILGFNALQSENTALKARVKYLEEHSLIVE